MVLSDKDLNFLKETSRLWLRCLLYFREYKKICDETFKIKRCSGACYTDTDKLMLDIKKLLEKISIDDFINLEKSLKLGIFISWEKIKLFKCMDIYRDRRLVIRIIKKSIKDIQTLIYLRDQDPKSVRRQIVWHEKGSIRDLYDRVLHEDPNISLDIFTKNYRNLQRSIKIDELGIAWWNSVKNVCYKKIVNIFAKGLLFHSTPYNWAVKEVIRFRRIGLRSPSEIKKVGKGRRGASIYPWAISLLYNSGRHVSDFWNDQFGNRHNHYHINEEVTFIIDPNFVRSSGQFCYLNPDKELLPQLALAGIDTESPEELFMPRQRNDHFYDEVISLKPIPFEAIIGIVIKKEDLSKISGFIDKLAQRNYKDAIPIYDVEGNIIWPIQIKF